jgi:NAD(P)-dependent dehydrogenase (short-subunit alcohol dehydrogenase family)
VITRLEGRVAVVTGGASGIGLALARALLAKRMKVTITDVSASALARAQATLGGTAQLRTVVSDASSFAALTALADSVVDAFGAVHLVCLNAGLIRLRSLRETSIDDWILQRSTMLDGVFYGIKAFLPHLDRADEAHIVVTSSIWGYFCDPLAGAYNAAKAGAAAVAEVLDTELRQEHSHIGVTCLAPGPVSTNIIHGIAGAGGASAQEVIDLIRNGANPDEVADAVLLAIQDGTFALPFNVSDSDWQRVDERVRRLRQGARSDHG